MFHSWRKKIISFIPNSKNIDLRKECVKICVIYLISGFLWILFSDRIMMYLSAGNNRTIVLISTYKGWIYIVLTGILLYILVNNLLIKVDKIEGSLQESSEELMAANEELEAYVQQLMASEEALRLQNEALSESKMKLSRSEEKNLSIIKALPDLLFVVDKEGVFLDCMVSDESRLYVPKNVFVGKKIEEVMPALSHDIMDKISAVFEHNGLEKMEYSLSESGEESIFELRMVRNNDREILAIARDVTVERQQEIELRISEEKYKNLINQMQLGLALYEGIDDQHVENYVMIDVNDCHEQLTGLIKNEILGKTIAEIFPKMEMENIRKLQATASKGETSRYERYQERSGRYYEIISYRPKKYQLVIIVNDITQRKFAEEALKVSETNFRSLFENSSDGIVISNQEIIVECNTAAHEMLGYDKEQDLIGKSFLALSPKRQPDGELSQEKMQTVSNLAVEQGKYKFEWWHEKKDGTLIPVEVMLTTIYRKGNTMFHSLWRDIGDRKKMENRLEFLSYHDQLTGIYNRRYFDEELIRIDKESNLPITIVMADINGLKLINDSFGHTYGDELIIKVTQIMNKACRKQDVLCRLSGDEFIVILPNTNRSEAGRLVQSMQDYAAAEKVGLVDISVSYGFATKYDAEEILDEILKKAEDHMYSKKLFESPSMRGRAIQTIITTLNEKNKWEERHSRNVSDLCERLGKALNFGDQEVKELKTLGLIHDIGKIAIDDSILNKKGELTEEEWEEVKRHPEIGYRILSTVNDLSELADFVLAHHERWDGTGYPKGLKQEEIPIQSRIVAIADAYDAMTSERSFRGALTEEYAIRELKENAGKQFSENLVKVFIEKVLHKTYK